MSSLLFVITFFLYYSAFSKEKDIYHVITGESDMPHKRSLDPVYYVGVYDKKPLSLPAKYEIELMTADSGKRFTCIIPKDGSQTKIDEHTTDAPITNAEDSETDINEQDNELQLDEEETLDIDEIFLDEEPIKTKEELLQEVDTLENRDRYIQELMVQSSNRRMNKKTKVIKNKKQPTHHCYFSREGYWSYELCLYDKITQFHGSKNKRNPSIKLGDYVTYVDVSKILMNDVNYPYLYLKDIYGLALFENSEKNFIHLLYTGGNDKRECVVSIQCSNTYGKKTKDGIIKISEPKIHNYHFTFIYKSVCNYNQWLEKEYNIYDANTLTESITNNNNNNNIFEGGDTTATAGTTASDLLIQKGINPNSNDVSLLLSPLLESAKNNKCLLLKQGWWTVEFCYAKFLRQIHLEAKKQKNKKGQVVQSLTEWDIKQEHVVGRWDKNRVTKQSDYKVHKNINDPSRTYASITYGNGDECDLTKVPRNTEIQFRCSMNNKYQSELVKSREDPSCHYIAQVETPLLCGHPDFKIPTAPKYEIVCYPFQQDEFVNSASQMKQVADIQSETDQILKMVTMAAKEKYDEEERQNNDENNVVTDETNHEENKQSQKLEL